MRFAQTRDFPVLKELWIQAFSEEDGFMEAFFAERAECENILVEEDDSGNLVSMLFLLPCKLRRSDGIEFSAVNIVGVATAVSQRHKGYMTRLINSCFKLLEDRKVDIAVLKPSNTAFYEQYGFKECNALYEIDLLELVDMLGECANSFETGVEGDISDCIYTGDAITSEVIARLNDIYNEAYCPGYKLLRSDTDWKFNLRDGIVFIDRASQVYALCEDKSGRLVANEVVTAASRKNIFQHKTGCTMAKAISRRVGDIGVENFIFEQY